jgi:hypothetical protein
MLTYLLASCSRWILSRRNILKQITSDEQCTVVRHCSAVEVGVILGYAYMHLRNPLIQP